MGAVFLGWYGGLSYQTFRLEYQRHQLDPASSIDPYDHQGAARFWGWYNHFMAGYLPIPQLSLLTSGWLLLWLAVRPMTPTALVNLALFALLQLVFSSLQFFAVETDWPHSGQPCREPGHRCRSLDWPVWLACIHFGYHLEHPSNPQLVWFELPLLLRSRLKQGGGARSTERLADREPLNGRMARLAGGLLPTSNVLLICR